MPDQYQSLFSLFANNLPLWKLFQITTLDFVLRVLPWYFNPQIFVQKDRYIIKGAVKDPVLFIFSFLLLAQLLKSKGAHSFAGCLLTDRECFYRIRECRGHPWMVKMILGYEGSWNKTVGSGSMGKSDRYPMRFLSCSFTAARISLWFWSSFLSAIRCLVPLSSLCSTRSLLDSSSGLSLF